MALIIDENGRVVDRTDKSIDQLKRDQYKHALNEEIEDIEDFVESLEEVEDTTDPEDDDSIPEEVDVDMVADIAIQYTQFRNKFAEAFGEGILVDAFTQIEDFFSEKGVDVSIDLAELDEKEEDIPGIESSEQSIVSSEIEKE